MHGLALRFFFLVGLVVVGGVDDDDEGRSKEQKNLHIPAPIQGVIIGRDGSEQG